MDYIVRNGNMELQVYARGNTNSSIMIVFLHGGPGSGAQPLMELPAFQALEAEYCCIYFDQRGSGKSMYDLKKGLNIDTICTDVECVIKDGIERWCPETIYLWGGSFGGKLACLYAEHIGYGVDAYLLSNPAITFTREQSIAQFQRMAVSMNKRLQITEDTSQLLEPEIVFNDPQFNAFIYSDANPSKSLRHTQAMSSWFFQHTFMETLRTMDRPVLILNGKEDPICDCRIVEDAVAELNNPFLHLQLLSPCGHAAFEDKPEEFIAITKDFINSFVK